MYSPPCAWPKCLTYFKIFTLVTIAHYVRYITESECYLLSTRFRMRGKTTADCWLRICLVVQIVCNRSTFRYTCTKRHNLITRYESTFQKHANEYYNLSPVRNVELGNNCTATNDKHISNVIFVAKLCETFLLLPFRIDKILYRLHGRCLQVPVASVHNVVLDLFRSNSCVRMNGRTEIYAASRR